MKMLSYMAFHEWAEKRVSDGDTQSQCPACGLWFFKEEMGNA
jgi:hypothetical protein